MKKILSFFAAMLFAGSMMAAVETEVSVIIYASSGDYYAKTHEWVKGDQAGATPYDQVVLDNVISANLIGTGNNGKYYSDWRFYTKGSDDGSFSIDAIEGYALKSATFTYTTTNSGALYMGETKLTSKTAVELSGRQAVFQCKNTNTSDNGQVRLTAITVIYEESGSVEPPVETKYYMKNNWGAGSDWTWKEMSKSVTGAGLYVLENVVYGGTGVNYNTVASDNGSSWVAQDAMEGDNAQIAAKDTVSFTLNPAKGAVVAKLVGKFQEGTEPPVMTPKFYITGNAALVGDELAWNPAAIPSYTEEYVFEKLTAAEYQLKITENGKWESAKGFGDLVSVPEGVTEGENGNIVFKLAKEQSDLKVSYAGGKITLVGEFYVEEPPVVVDPDQMYVWDGRGVTKAEEAIELGGKAEAVEAENKSNIVIGAAQKGNWCLKLNKGFASGANYVGIALNNAVNAGDTVKVAHFRTGDKDCFLGMDFSADKTSVSTDYQIITTENPQILSSNGVPTDVDFIVPEGVKDAKYIRVYRNSGSTGLWIAHFEIVKNQGGSVEPPVSDKYYMKNNWDGGEWTWLEMTPSDAAVNQYMLKDAIFGGTGVNYNKVADDKDATWVPLDEIIVDVDMKLEAKDTADFVLDVVAKTVSALNIRKFQGGEPPVGTPLYYITGESLVGSWEPNALPVYEKSLYEFASVKAGSYSFKITVDGTWATAKGYDDLTLKQDGLSKDKDGNICFTLAEDGPVSVLYTAEEFIVRGNFVVSEPPVNTCNWDDIEWFNVGLGEGDESFNQFKICKQGELPNVVNIQTAPWADNNKGIYINFPSAEFTTVSLPEGQYKIDGAGILLFLSAFSAQETEVTIQYKGEPVVFTVYNGKVDAPEVKYYMKNNWDAGSEWTWKEMTKMEGADGIYRLEQVIFGGTGVNYNTKADDEGAAWVPLENIVVPEGMTLEAKDTADFQLEIAGPAPVVRALGIRKFQGGEPPVEVNYYLKNNWGAGDDWFWVKMEKSATAAGLYVLEGAVYGGTGVNFNIVESDEGSTWVPQDAFEIAQELKLEPKDTADFWLNPNATGEAAIKVANIRKFQGSVEPPVSEWDEIVFTEVVAAADLAPDASFSNGESNFVLSIVDNKNKMAIDANGCRFGTAESYVTYSHRLKSGGTGSADNQMILSIPADGELRIAARTGSNGATDRNLVITQEEAELYNKVVQESDAVTVKEMNAAGEEIDAKVYPYISVAVKAGRVILSYPTGSLNFYAFAFKAGGSEPPADEHIYSVAGSGALLGSNWNEKEGNEMEKQADGTYKLVIENIELAVGNYEYKVVIDHKWNNGEAGANSVLSIVEGGLYDVTFTYEPTEPKTDAQAELKQAVVVLPKVQLAGAFNDWKGADLVDVDKEKAVISLTLDKKSYEFKMILNSNWLGNGKEFTRTDNKLEALEVNGDNMKLVADAAGDYLFTWTYATNTLEITFPEVGPVEDPTVAVIGSMTEWQEAIPFTLSEDKKSATLVVDKIPVGEYQFKMLINGDYRSNGYTFNRNFTGAAGISENANDNMLLQVDIMGEFTFEWFFENDSLNIIFPEKSEIPDLYIKNNWGGAEEWSWKKMTYEVVEGNGVYYIMDVVFGGTGVNLNGEPSDEDALWFPVEKIQAFTPAQEKTTLNELDTVMFAYYPAFETLIAVVTGPYNAPACEFEDGLYLIGSMTNWEMSKEYMLEINSNASADEFWCEVTLSEGDEFKIIWWTGCQIGAWIPGGEGNNIVVDAAHAGKLRIYVRPAGNDEWPDKYWFIEVVEPQNINNTEVNTKVVKMIENGQLFIQKGGKTYNVIGTLVK